MDQYRAETPRTIRLASLLLRCGRVALLILCLWLPFSIGPPDCPGRAPLPNSLRPIPCHRTNEPAGLHHPGGSETQEVVPHDGQEEDR